MPALAYIGIGSNVGDKKENCRRAIELLKEAGRVTAVSSLYCTEPVGYREQEDFINAVAAVETAKPPRELLELCQSIEHGMGRTRTVRWGPRVIDLDILLYGERILNEADLVIPHPLIQERRFVLVPLAEISPDTIHPVLKKTVAELCRGLQDSSRVKKCGPGGKLP